MQLLSCVSHIASARWLWVARACRVGQQRQRAVPHCGKLCRDASLVISLLVAQVIYCILAQN